MKKMPAKQLVWSVEGTLQQEHWVKHANKERFLPGETLMMKNSYPCTVWDVVREDEDICHGACFGASKIATKRKLSNATHIVFVIAVFKTHVFALVNGVTGWINSYNLKRCDKTGFESVNAEEVWVSY